MLSTLVLAAGLGTRLLPYSAKVPKPLVPILDRSLLEHQFAAVRQMGIPLGTMMVNAHHLPQMVLAAAEQLGADRVFIEPEILGTGGPLQQVFEQGIADELLVLNGDVFHDFDLRDFVESARQAGQDFALLCLDHGPLTLSLNAQGLICGRDGKYQVGESVRKLAFSGVSWYSAKALARLRKDDFNVVDFWAREASAGQMPYAHIAPPQAMWIDMGSPQGYFEACQQRLAQMKSDRWADSSAKVHPANLGPHAMICAHAEIASGVYLENCLVLPHAQILQPGKYEKQIIGQDFQWEINA